MPSPALPPGPPPVDSPLKLFRYMRAIGRDPIAFQRRRFEEYGDTYLSVVRDIETVVTREPEHIHQVLVADGDAFQKPETGLGAAGLRMLLGLGLVSSNGDLWRNQRRKIQPAFDARHLKQYVASMVAFAEETAESWRHGQHVDVSREMMALTLRVVGKVLFGQDTQAEEGRVGEAMRAFRTSFGGLAAVVPAWIPYPARRRGFAARARMQEMMDTWVREARAGRSTDESCLLAVLARGMDEADGMSDEQLRDEALTLFFAGHETTSHALSWTWLLLSQHPAVRDRATAEVDRVLEKRAATFDDYGALPYTQQVLSEAMRLYPPVFSIAREARRDTEVGPYRVPKGAHVVTSIYHAHHDGRWHRDPERFDPERFAPDLAKAMLPGSYLPFGSGTRTCIGKRFALVEGTLMLATMLRRCRLELAQPEVPVPSTAVTLEPRGGIRMRVVKREG